VLTAEAIFLLEAITFRLLIKLGCAVAKFFLSSEFGTKLQWELTIFGDTQIAFNTM